MKISFKQFLEETKKKNPGFKIPVVPRQEQPIGNKPPPSIRGTKRVKDGSFWKLVDKDDPRYKDVKEPKEVFDNYDDWLSAAHNKSI